MLQRLTTGWNLQRGLFVAIGTMVIIQAFYEKQWLGLAFGAYFASMGLFRFGCASGGCFGGSCAVDPVTDSKKKVTEEVVFQEIKKN